MTDIAKAAYEYGYPIVDLYNILHSYALDPASSEFKAPLNQVGNVRQVASPSDTTVIAPNVDTPYSYAWLDLRAGPLVVSMPSFEKGRYVSLQLLDTYTHIIDYVSPRTNGNVGGDFLVVGPGWKGVTPKGIRRVFRSPTRLALGLFRTQLFSPGDLARVHAIQDGFRVRPLSSWLGGKAVVSAPLPLLVSPVNLRQSPTTLEFFNVLNWMLAQMPVLPEDVELRRSFARIGIVPGATFVQPDAAVRAQVLEGMRAGLAEMGERARRVRSSAELFGSREHFAGDNLTRAVGAMLGVLGNSAEEYLGIGYQADANGQAFDGRYRYRIRFAPEGLPPVGAFWSITVYTPERLLYANTLARYVINSAMLPALNRDPDGGITLFVQHDSPGAGVEANWLPVPAAPFGLTFRTYLPGEAIRAGKWTAPPVVRLAEPAATLTLEQRVDAAFEATFPIYEMARARFNAMVNPLNPAPSAVNGTPVHRRGLIDHTARDVTTPNNDTLYSATWLDLHATPVRIHVPRVAGGRYWSVALLDIFTNNFAILGREHDGEGPVDVTLVGPGWAGPLPEGRVLRSPSNDVQLVGRFLTDGLEDAPTVHALQDGLRVEPVDPGARLLPQWVPVTRSTNAENFLAVVNEMLSRNPVPAAEANLYESWADLGIGGGAYAFTRASPDVQAAWRARLPALHEGLREGLKRGARTVAGWTVPSPEVGDFGTNYSLRAAVAFGGLSALASREAIYLNLETDPASGKPLIGERRYRLIVPPIPARGFWSLSMYEKDADGRLFFAANPLGRYSIGDRTPGLRRQRNGNIELLLQHKAPADRSNWLPTPPGQWAITLRVYLPSEAMRRGEAPLPRLVVTP